MREFDSSAADGVHSGEHPFDLVLRLLRERGGKVLIHAKRPDQARAICPSHRDRRASLFLTRLPNTVLIHCHGGCPKGVPAKALGLRPAELFVRGAPRARSAPAIVETYDYCDSSGVLLQKVRLANKTFPWRRADPDAPGGFRWGLDERTPGLFGEKELVGASRVFITEGEKASKRLRDLGLHATCGYGGAGFWRLESSEKLYALGCRELVILADRDRAGEAHAELVAASMCALVMLEPVLVTVVTFDDLGPGDDVWDFLEAGHTLDDLLAKVAATPMWTPGAIEARRAERERAKARDRVRKSRARQRELAGKPKRPPRVTRFASVLRAIETALSRRGEQSGPTLKRALRHHHSAGAVDEALKLGAENGALVVFTGAGNKPLYRLCVAVGVSHPGHSAAAMSAPSPAAPANVPGQADAEPSDRRMFAAAMPVSECPETPNTETPSGHGQPTGRGAAIANAAVRVPDKRDDEQPDRPMLAAPIPVSECPETPNTETPCVRTSLSLQKTVQKYGSYAGVSPPPDNGPANAGERTNEEARARATPTTTEATLSPVIHQAAAVLQRAIGRGLEITLVDGRPRIGDRRVLRHDERAVLAAVSKAEAEALALALVWRVDAMRGQMRASPHVVPYLRATHAVVPPGSCDSCAASSATARCPVCSLAACLACGPDTTTGRVDPPVLDDPVALVCCGDFDDDRRGALVLACKLCPRSSSYWQRPSVEAVMAPEAERHDGGHLSSQRATDPTGHKARIGEPRRQAARDGDRRRAGGPRVPRRPR